MSDSDTVSDGTTLQFDRAVVRSQEGTVEQSSVTCASCRTAIRDEYYDVNGHSVCARCRVRFETAAETPAGIGPLAIAGAFGFVAAIAGAIIYYAILAYAHLEIGIVAILIGYMVGYSVRKGARGGGLRFQILAVTLTYMSIALAYAPIAVRAAITAQNTRPGQQGQPANAGATPSLGTGNIRAARATPNAMQLTTAIALLLGLIAALPVLAIFETLPAGLLSAFIILIGLRQAWRMTAAPFVQVLGPYRVGTTAATTSA